ncbi:MAG: 50S ribosomal protein L21 [Beijerinckiaceae bacterium]
MFAVIKTGGKQYRVAAEDKITVEKLPGEAGDAVAFDNVVMLVRDGATDIGAPFVAGATVAGEIVEQGRGAKVINFKKRRRQNSKRKKGHRQDLTIVRITAILTGGAKPNAKAKTAAPVASAPAAAAAPVAATGDASNLSLIAGVGPTIEKKLRAAGVTSWDHIAAWTDEDVARWDAELKLGGRPKRDEWIEQAKELLAGKAPRAKVDQAEQKSGEDR